MNTIPFPTPRTPKAYKYVREPESPSERYSQPAPPSLPSLKSWRETCRAHSIRSTSTNTVSSRDSSQAIPFRNVNVNVNVNVDIMVNPSFNASTSNLLAVPTAAGLLSTPRRNLHYSSTSASASASQEYPVEFLEMPSPFYVEKSVVVGFEEGVKVSEGGKGVKGLKGLKGLKEKGVMPMREWDVKDRAFTLVRKQLKKVIVRSGVNKRKGGDRKL
ncbi:hypothetical protein K474DRAFT_1776002 [Panus rudis PR-1116 ss-1]|nr:hypothetical protein K474DRAFT_1776002 [Panus rudis PR-1116 ss-1]